MITCATINPGSYLNPMEAGASLNVDLEVEISPDGKVQNLTGHTYTGKHFEHRNLKLIGRAIEEAAPMIEAAMSLTTCYLCHGRTL